MYENLKLSTFFSLKLPHKLSSYTYKACNSLQRYISSNICYIGRNNILVYLKEVSDFECWHLRKNELEISEPTQHFMFPRNMFVKVIKSAFNDKRTNIYASDTYNLFFHICSICVPRWRNIAYKLINFSLLI